MRTNANDYVQKRAAAVATVTETNVSIKRKEYKPPAERIVVCNSAMVH